MDAERNDVNDLEGSFLALLRRHPTARVAILGADGATGGLPTSLPIDPALVLLSGSALHLVATDDRVAAIGAWSEMLEVGWSALDARFAQQPDVVVHSWFFDLRAEHGVCVALLVPADPSMELVPFESEERGELSPRIAHMTKDELSAVVSIDEQVTRMLGWDPEDVVGKRGLELVHPDDHDGAIMSWMNMINTPGHSYSTRLRHLHKDGHWVWIQTLNHNCLDLEVDPCVRTEIVDISGEVVALEALRDRERLLDRLAEALPVGIFQVDRDGRTTYRNNRLLQILGRDPVGEMLAPDMLGLHPDDAEQLDSAVRAALGDGLGAEIEIRFVHGATLMERRVNMVIRPLGGDEGAVTGAIATVEDVTDSARMRLELEHRATFDQLTGCLNRVSILDELDRALLRLGSGGGVAVVFLDLDSFKEINDGWGHAAGDDVLAALAGRLRSGTRLGDMAGRIGGDEFLVVCPGVANASEARAIAERVSTAVSGPVAVPGGSIRQQVSVGVAWTGVRVQADALIARADQAMYESKRLNRGEPVCALTD